MPACFLVLALLTSFLPSSCVHARLPICPPPHSRLAVCLPPACLSACLPACLLRVHRYAIAPFLQNRIVNIALQEEKKREEEAVPTVETKAEMQHEEAREEVLEEMTEVAKDAATHEAEHQAEAKAEEIRQEAVRAALEAEHLAEA